MYLLCVIPARQGSKGIKNKNFRLVGGKPLIQHTFELTSKITGIDQLILSTDSAEIMELAKNYPKVKVPFKRPSSLSKDNTPMVEVLKHAILNSSKTDEIDTVLLLQPTSPFRSVELVNKAINEYKKADVDTLVSVSRTKHHPAWSFWLRDKQLYPILDDPPATRRQDLDPVVAINGALYITKSRLILENNTILGSSILPLEMDPPHSMDIDNTFDLFVADMIAKNWKDWYANFQN